MKRKIELSAKTSPKIKLLRKAFFALAVDPFLKGINIRSRASHLRSQLSIEIEKALYPLKPSKIHAQITDFDLYGGIDISNSIKDLYLILTLLFTLILVPKWNAISAGSAPAP